jgi:hypothetical protein
MLPSMMLTDAWEPYDNVSSCADETLFITLASSGDLECPQHDRNITKEVP